MEVPVIPQPYPLYATADPVFTGGGVFLVVGWEQTRHKADHRIGLSEQIVYEPVLAPMAGGEQVQAHTVFTLYVSLEEAIRADREDQQARMDATDPNFPEPDDLGSTEDPPDPNFD
jgi:hypothetical protein